VTLGNSAPAIRNCNVRRSAPIGHGTELGTIKMRKTGRRGWQPVSLSKMARTTYRAGDRTRTGDVQLGKPSEANGLVA
jgi:hypothetical protein